MVSNSNGRFSTVYKAKAGDVTLAVKKFKEEDRKMFLKEKDIYCLPNIRHRSLLGYWGAQEQQEQQGTGGMGQVTVSFQFGV